MPDKQISTLLHVCHFGEEADSALTSYNAMEDDQKAYNEWWNLFGGFFHVQWNTFEPTWFSWRNQVWGESARQYIVSWYILHVTTKCNNSGLELLFQDQTYFPFCEIVAGCGDQIQKSKMAIFQQEVVQEQ